VTDFLLITHNIQGVGTFGTLFFKGEQIANSVEREWLNNEKNISCVPGGDYDLIWHNSSKFGNVIALSNPNVGVVVQGKGLRTHCYVHAANFASQLQGCIALGSKFSTQHIGVIDSRNTIKKFNKLVLMNPKAKLKVTRF